MSIERSIRVPIESEFALPQVPHNSKNPYASTTPSTANKAAKEAYDCHHYANRIPTERRGCS